MESPKRNPELAVIQDALISLRAFRDKVVASAKAIVREHGGILNDLGAGDSDMPVGTGTILALTKVSISGIDNSEDLEGGYVRLNYIVPSRMSAKLPSISGCNLISRGQPYWTLEIPLAMLVNGDSQPVERSEVEAGKTASELNGSIESEILDVFGSC